MAGIGYTYWDYLGNEAEDEPVIEREERKRRKERKEREEREKEITDEEPVEEFNKEWKPKTGGKYSKRSKTHKKKSHKKRARKSRAKAYRKTKKGRSKSRISIKMK
jgi:hypothetical protein